MGVNVSILLDGRDIWKGPQELYVSIGECSSATVKDVPFIVRDPRVGADPVKKKGETEKTISIVLEGPDVTSSNRVLVLLDRNEGRGGGKSREDRENDRDELFVNMAARSWVSYV